MASAVVGRADELGRVSDLVRGAQHGRFGAMAVEGDAGIGKTTLVRAARDRAGEGVLVLPGSCLPMTSLGVPLLGLRSAVRALAPQERPAALAPIPVGAGGTPVPVPVAFDDWLCERARSQPVVLTLDDLQWADEATLDALTYVLAGPAERALAVLLTIRTSEVGVLHPVRRWLADARRLPGFGELVLGPLTRDGVGAQVELLLGEPPHSSLVEQVHDRSGGNPLLVRLLVDGLDPSATSLPPHLPAALSDAVLRPWETLSAPARRMLLALAVGGHPASGRALARAVRVAAVDDPGPVLAEAVAAGMLEDRDDGYWFHHPLQAQALEASLPAADRRVLHAGVAAGYEQDAEDGLTSELAETISDHHLLAGHAEAAYRWALTAADARAGAHDRPGELRMLRRAADLHGRLESPARPLAVVLEEIRRAARDEGDGEGELAAVEALLDVVDERVEPLRVAVLLAWRGLVRSRLGMEEAEDLTRALELSAGCTGTWQRVVVAAEHSRRLLWAGEVEQARSFVREAVDAAESSGARPRGPDEDDEDDEDEWARAGAFAWAQVLMLAAFEGDDVTAAGAGPRAADAAAAAGDAALMVHVIMWHANAVTDVGLEWAALLDAGARRMESLHMPQRFVAWLSAAVAEDYWTFGRVQTCLARLRVALGSDIGASGNHMARMGAALLAASQGRQAEAEAHLARAWELIEDPLAHPNLSAAAGTAHVRLYGGDAEGALDIALAGMRGPGVHPTRCEWLAPLAARALADLARADLDAGRDPVANRRRAEQVRQEFPEVLRDLGVRSRSYAARLEALQALYDAEAARAGLLDHGPDRWLRAEELLGGVGFVWDEVYACRRAGEALLAGGTAEGRRRAAATLRRGHALAERLGAGPDREAIASLARAARIRLDVVYAPGDAVATGTSALTRREREVLEHVVAGRTYAEIAEALFVSEKTVSSHISHILDKTGAANRVELAEWARRRERVS